MYVTVKMGLRVTSLVIHWLRFQDSTARHMGWIPGWGSKIPHASVAQANFRFFHLIEEHRVKMLVLLQNCMIGGKSAYPRISITQDCIFNKNRIK